MVLSVSCAKSSWQLPPAEVAACQGGFCALFSKLGAGLCRYLPHTDRGQALLLNCF